MSFFYANHLLTKKSAHSDRVALAVRMTRDNHREWLDASGTIALVFHEKGKWWGRLSPWHLRHAFATEQEALDFVLNDFLFDVRRESRGF
jgi:hypothetical protein